MDQNSDAGGSSVRISTDGPTARVEVDGRDVGPDVRAYSLQHEAGQLPELTLLLAPHRFGGWDGTARVAIGEEPDPGPAAAAFLAAIDAGELERAVLNRHDLMDGGQYEFTRALLVQLAQWALGEQIVLEDES
ncbi:hypothetical protein AB0K51_09380 [Kitasatospora sp. NPDC049285]|uniref:hypothetical protein n=1 Tax=Kitasatospora sp. NPDC049285 TaxID=3157096 RepID=UPI003428ECCB